jgi:glycosyltransferase involved in cell wall biosynthesis
MSSLAVIILTKNEENNILDCLECVQNLDEIIIIDDYSEDRTVELIQSASWRTKIKIYKRHLDGDFSAQRNFGLSKATRDWVLFIDADERVSTSLREEIKHKTANSKNKEINGYYIKRRDAMWGKKLRHGETGNISLLRLARKDAGKWEGKVHEVWKVKGRIEELESELAHYPHQSVKEFLDEINIYSSIRASELKKQNVKVKFFDIILYPKAKFFKNFVLKLGFLDGLPGLITALMMSFHSFLVRSKLWLLQNVKL